MKNILLFIFLFAATTTHAQDLNGVWKGSLKTGIGCFAENNIELTLTINGNSVTGETYHYQDKNNYIRKACTGTYNAAKKILKIKEGKVVDFRLPGNCAICIKNFKLNYRNDNGKEILEGDWTGTLLDFGNECLPGSITLYRQENK